jgi:hypothetical protein
VKDRQLVVGVEDDEADRSRAGELEDDGVDSGEVIRQQQEATRGQAIGKVRSDAIE